MGSTGDSKLIKQFFSVPLRDMILWIIAARGEMHGYGIMKVFEEITFGSWKPSPSTLYTLLDTMVNEGLLERVEEYRGRMKRIKYRLTDKAWRIIAFEIDFVTAMLNNILSEVKRIKMVIEEKGARPLMDREMLRERIEALKKSRDIISRRIDALEKLLREMEEH